MLSIFPSHAGPQIHDSHAQYFPVASWSSNARLLFATMLGIFQSQAGPQMHDCSLLPCWVFSSRKLVLKSTTAILNTFRLQAGPQIHDSHAEYFPVACWSSNPRQPC